VALPASLGKASPQRTPPSPKAHSVGTVVRSKLVVTTWRSCGSYPEIEEAHPMLLPLLTGRASYTWTRKRRCLCARTMGPRARGVGLQRLL
jgi:hypothetical protein